MLHGQIEREMADGESWLLWQQPRVTHHIQHLVEKEQGTIDIYDQTLLAQTEDFRISASNWSDTNRGSVSSLYQVFHHYLCLLVGR